MRPVTRIPTESADSESEDIVVSVIAQSRLSTLNPQELFEPTALPEKEKGLNRWHGPESVYVDVVTARCDSGSARRPGGNVTMLFQLVKSNMKSYKIIQNITFL